MCDMTHPYVWHGSWLETRDVILLMTVACVWYHTFICVTWLPCMCDKAYSYVQDGSLTCVTWLIHMCDMTHSYVWHGSLTCVTWLKTIQSSTLSRVPRLICICNMAHSYVWHDSFLCAALLIYCVPWHRRFSQGPFHVCHNSFVFVTWLIHMCDMTHFYMWHY